jgi:hypothetical protein
MSDPPGDPLDLLLAAWAGEQRLDDQAAARMLAAIVAPAPPGLAISFWSELSSRVTAAIVLASAPTGRPGSVSAA